MSHNVQYLQSQVSQQFELPELSTTVFSQKLNKIENSKKLFIFDQISSPILSNKTFLFHAMFNKYFQTINPIYIQSTVKDSIPLLRTK